MSRPFHWGIIGPGKIAHQFAQDIAQLEDARLHAVASRSVERAAAFAQQYGALHVYGDYEAITSCPDLDAVYIATPHSGHCENTIRCLEAGIPVLCEKPFAMNAMQAKQMIALARAKEVFLMEALWTRFLPNTIKMLELLEGDKIGPVLSVKADFGFKAPFDPNSRIFNPALGGGALLDIGIYPVFLALLIMGKPLRIKALARMGSTGVDIDTGILFQYEDERMAHLHATLTARTKTEAFIYGEKGTIHIHSRWHEPTNFSIISADGRPVNYNFDRNSNGYDHEAKEVMRCVRAGLTESPTWSLKNTMDLMFLLDEIRREIGLEYPGD